MRVAASAQYIPPERYPMAEYIAANGQNIYEAKAFSRLFGFENVAANTELTLKGAFKKLLDQLTFEGGLPDVLIYCHGNPVQYAGDTSPVAELRMSHPALSQVEHFYELDQHTCSTMFWAMDVAEHFLNDGARKVLILAGDSVEGMPASERHALGVTAVGDAFAALVLDKNSEGPEISGLYTNARHEFHHGRTGTPEERTEFNTHHTDLVTEVLDAVPHDTDSGRPILPHNVNYLTWKKFSTDSGIPMNQVWLDLLPDVGHCYTVDATLMLERFMQSDEIAATMLSVGQGGFVGGCTIRKAATVCSL